MRNKKRSSVFSIYFTLIVFIFTIGMIVGFTSIQNNNAKEIEVLTNKERDDINKEKEHKRKNDIKSNAQIGVTKIKVEREELILLEKIVASEAIGEPYEGKVAVVNVIMNRVDSEDFPNTIKEVVYQKGQFSPVSNGRINEIKPNEEVKEAVKDALGGEKVVSDETLYFLNPDIATDLTIPKTKEYVKTIENHAFYK